MIMIDLYNRLAILGTVVELKTKIDNPIGFVQDTERDYDYVIYNPRKSINRFGLSITSLDGKLTGIPDLDSLSEYNKENGTTYTERDFNKPTPLYYDTRLAELTSLFKNNIVRSHILRIDPGGYFPAHRDSYRSGNYFRIIVPLKNVKPPQFYFIIDNEIKLWNIGSVYFVDTIKAHVLFNASLSSSYWIVFNIITNNDTIETVLNNVLIC
jgi:hypothetical protein